ncbi:hypothetical protein [Piscinibacter sakaiensis]|uniref:hypothetical protein n=1 Tax=Piscinibacter sakaiensis TaxID=1547922 RepID=UPI003AAB4FA6
MNSRHEPIEHDQTASATSERREEADRLLNGIAWASIVIGAAELVLPRRTRNTVSVGIGGVWMRLRGLRSIAGGIALLVADDKERWLNRRSIANALDCVTLAWHHHDGDADDRKRNGVAIGAIGLLTAVDMTAARKMELASRRADAGASSAQPVNRG